MKKYFTLVFALIFCAFGAIANDSTANAVAEPMAINEIADSIGVNSEISDSLLLPDTLEMSVPAPVLEWDVVGGTRVAVKPNYIFVPLIFEEYPATDMYDTKNNVADVYLSGLALDVNNSWLTSSIKDREDVAKLRFETMVNRPQDVQYNEKDLPEPPKSYVLVTDPSKRSVTIEERKFDNVPSAQGDKLKILNWLHTYSVSVQVYFSLSL